MNDSVVPPQKVAFNKDELALDIMWKNGEQSTISGMDLRRYCACSQCRAKKVVGINIINQSSTLVSVELIGGQGLQATFSDGHDKGIFPWSYLYAIATGSALEYFSE